MKVVILAGGFGTRLREETTIKPKPMVEIGQYPIIWHIMKHYSHYGLNEFVIALGYKGEIIKDYFLNYSHRNSDITVNTLSGDVSVVNSKSEEWIVHLIDTGLNSRTGTRVKIAAEFCGREPIMMTYGDGVSDINIKKLLDFHRGHGKSCTVTAVRPVSRFGGLTINGDIVKRFKEKEQISEGWINGGYFVIESDAVKYIDKDVNWEREPLEHLARDGQLMAYKHEGFWQCMDTQRDADQLREMWNTNNAPWAVWNK